MKWKGGPDEVPGAAVWTVMSLRETKGQQVVVGASEVNCACMCLAGSIMEGLCITRWF
jgi:hypothetical protein